MPDGVSGGRLLRYRSAAVDIEPARLKALLEADGEFRRASRLWSGSFALADEGGYVRIEVGRGQLESVDAGAGSPNADTVFKGPAEGWAKVFAPAPPPYYQDLVGGAVGRHGFAMSGDTLQMAAYYPAIQRAVRLAGQARGR